MHKKTYNETQKYTMYIQAIVISCGMWLVILAPAYGSKACRIGCSALVSS